MELAVLIRASRQAAKISNMLKGICRWNTTGIPLILSPYHVRKMPRRLILTT